LYSLFIIDDLIKNTKAQRRKGKRKKEKGKRKKEKGKRKKEKGKRKKLFYTTLKVS
jgi:hypothetical protein